jgi:hypothetical protein
METLGPMVTWPPETDCSGRNFTPVDGNVVWEKKGIENGNKKIQHINGHEVP